MRKEKEEGRNDSVCSGDRKHERCNMTEKETELRGSRVSDVQKGHSNTVFSPTWP